MADHVIVLDTHALLWWALDPSQLSEPAREVIAAMEQQGGFASSISIWEIAVKVKRGKLELPITVMDFASRVERGGVVELLPVDTTTWLQSVALPWTHSDPADRVIVTTALRRGMRVLTKDAAIHAFTAVEAIW